MKNENNQQAPQINPAQYGYPMPYQQEDEIDLYELFASIFSQWKMITAITLAGTLLAICYVMIIPSHYQALVQVARPEATDIKKLNIRGYEDYTPVKVFNKYYDQLRSAELFKVFLKETDWHKGKVADLSEEALFLRVFSGFETEIIRPLSKKTENVIPELVVVKLLGDDEAEVVNLLNNYAKFVNDSLVKQIKRKGKNAVSLEAEGLEQAIAGLRVDAKVRR